MEPNPCQPPDDDRFNGPVEVPSPVSWRNGTLVGGGVVFCIWSVVMVVEFVRWLFGF